MAPPQEALNLANSASETKKFIIIVSVFIITTISTFIYFYESLRILINIIVSIVVALFISFGIMAFIYLSDKSLSGSKGGNFIYGIVFLIFGIILFSGIRSCFYVNSEERAERLKREQIQIEANKLHALELLQREATETADFVISDEEYKIYGTFDNQQILLRCAEQAIKIFAYEPDTVTDVQAVTLALRLRIKQFPQCRYALQVQYRARNSFGAFVLTTAVILFDRDLNGFEILEKSPSFCLIR